MVCLRIQDKDIYMWRYVCIEKYAFLNCQQIGGITTIWVATDERFL